MSFNMMRAINSSRCALNAFGENGWYLFGSLYYAALEFGYDEDLEKQVQEYYPYQCTCVQEIQKVQKELGGSPLAITTFGGCSELVQKQKAKEREAEGGEVPEEDASEEIAGE